MNASWNLSDFIEIPQLDEQTIYRCRFVYSTKPETFEFSPYVPRMVKKLIVIDCGTLDYSYKYTDRSAIEALRNKIKFTENADVLLVKNGLVTDTSFSNIVFYDGTKWFTPAIPLLYGTKRAYYIQNKIVHPINISLSDLKKYAKIRLINAMLDLEAGYDIPVENVIYD